MKAASEFREIMRKNPLFMELDEADFSIILRNTSLYSLKSGEVLFRQQQAANEFFLLVKGKMKLSLLSFEGTEKVIDIVNVGSTFAEAIIFRRMSGYPVNAQALASSTVLRIDKEAYIDILSKSPEACFQVMARLSIRIHWLMNELNRLSLHNATYRLISYLLDSSEEDATPGTAVYLSIPKHVIASRISITPETFSRTIKRLSQQGLLEVHDSHIVLKDPEELRRLVSI